MPGVIEVQSVKEVGHRKGGCVSVSAVDNGDDGEWPVSGKIHILPQHTHTLVM